MAQSKSRRGHKGKKVAAAADQAPVARNATPMSNWESVPDGTFARTDGWVGMQLEPEPEPEPEPQAGDET